MCMNLPLSPWGSTSGLAVAWSCVFDGPLTRTQSRPCASPSLSKTPVEANSVYVPPAPEQTHQRVARRTRNASKTEALQPSGMTELATS
jgi:hypothetical protein